MSPTLCQPLSGTSHLHNVFSCLQIARQVLLFFFASLRRLFLIIKKSYREGLTQTFLPLNFPASSISFRYSNATICKACLVHAGSEIVFEIIYEIVIPPFLVIGKEGIGDPYFFCKVSGKREHFVLLRTEGQAFVLPVLVQVHRYCVILK